MYESFYGLRARPFGKSPDPSFLYESRAHAEALARIVTAAEDRDLAVLTGVVGAGKTTLTRALVDRLADSRDRSRAWIIAKLIESAARKQIEMDDFIQVGEDDIAAGRTIPHEELVDHIMNRRKQRAAA